MQTSIKTIESSVASDSNVPLQLMAPYQVATSKKVWYTVKEPIGVWSDNNFTYQGILEHLKVTKDNSDYLWYTTRYLQSVHKSLK